MDVRNLTPHTLNIHNEKGEIVNLARWGEVARVDVADKTIGSFGAINVVFGRAGEIVNLPDPKEGVVYVVSGMVAAAAKRQDVLSPGPLVRDDDGRPVGCRGLRAHVADLPLESWSDPCVYCGAENGSPEGSVRQGWDCYHCGGN